MVVSQHKEHQNSVQTRKSKAMTPAWGTDGEGGGLAEQDDTGGSEDQGGNGGKEDPGEDGGVEGWGATRGREVRSKTRERRDRGGAGGMRDPGGAFVMADHSTADRAQSQGRVEGLTGWEIHLTKMVVKWPEAKPKSWQ